jgi:hypothetical protein
MSPFVGSTTSIHGWAFSNQKLAPRCRHDKDGKDNRADENEHAFSSVTSVERQVRFQLQTVSVRMSVPRAPTHLEVRLKNALTIRGADDPRDDPVRDHHENDDHDEDRSGSRVDHVMDVVGVRMEAAFRWLRLDRVLRLL